MASKIATKRVYEDAARGDGWRVLVDRLWPRGLAKESAAIDAWLKDVAPSTALRRWFNHDPERWVEFQRRYREELAQQRAAVDELLTRARRGRVTLLYGARDEAHNQAVALAEYLREQL